MSPQRWRTILPLAAIAVAAALSRLLLAPALPDDYDGLGFVLALRDFDLAKFQPHFPGYPVYVALGRVALWLSSGGAPLQAALAVSAAASGVTVVGLWAIGRRLGGERAAVCAAALGAVAAMPWLLGASPLSDATGGALAVLAFAFLPRPFASGALLGLMLGARLSYWPLALSWLWLVRSRRWALVGVAAGVLAWLLPFALVIGPTLPSLARTHLSGHFGTWGGSVMTRPGLLVRLGALARDIFFDGVAPRLWLLLPAGALTLACAPRRPSLPAVETALVLAAPYLLWAWLGQNVLEQPRHALPLVLLLLVGVALAIARRPLVAVAVVALVATAAAPLAWAHAHTLPAAAQLQAYVARVDPSLPLFGVRSVRFCRVAGAPAILRERAWLSEVDVDLERLDVLPDTVWVTSEITGDPRRARRLKEEARFCRDERLDRQQPCLTLYRYRSVP